MMGRSAKKLLYLGVAGGLIFAAAVYPKNPPQEQTPQQINQVKAAKQRANDEKKKDKALYKELDSQYKDWLDKDVVYIITPEERSAFLHLQTNEARENFIESFWQRRNPDPDSVDNTVKEEHYRRIAYADEHFASGVPGWKTDRGRIYITWGPADEVDPHPSGGTYQRPADEGGGTTSTYPFEDWRYRYLPGIGENVILEFVDPSGTGEYHLTMDPSEKDALLYVPGAGLTDMEAMGLASKADRFTNSDGTHDAAPIGCSKSNGDGNNCGMPDDMDEFSRLERYAKIWQAPPVQYKDLEAVVTSRIVKDQVHFQYQWAFLRLTSDEVLVPIAIQIPRRQMSFHEKDGVDTAKLEIFGRITTVSGRRVTTFEDPVTASLPASLLQQSLSGSEIYGKTLPLASGLYRLDIVIKDVNSGNIGVVNTALPVPRFEDDQLSASTLILADDIERISSSSIGLGQFVIGDVKVRPKLGATFAQNDSVKVYLQVYNLKVDDKTHHADASVEYRVFNDKGSQVLKYDLPRNQLDEHGEELTIENSIALGSVPPGKYKVEVAVTDNVTKRVVTPSAQFTVKAAPAQGTQTAQGR
ncbi:MAG TPA: GWxTD domain-containing protein [Candidatus Acidoferrales bacterium]|nr:GWxTD domain-containing protein [Candidatus Acidoferrales bacterium]